MTTPPTPQVIDCDPATITAELIAQFEAATGRPLHPAQAERQLIDVLAYREVLVRLAIQDAALQNLVAFARYPMLDYLGELVGVTRLPARPASLVLRFTLTGPQPHSVAISAGTVVEARDGAVRFATSADLVVPAGETAGEVRAASLATGAAANGYLPGTITEISAPIAMVAAASNVSTSLGGAEAEGDERLRARIREAPATFSVAGSAASYRAHAMAAHPAVREVSVTSPRPGVVELTVLASGGIPPTEVLDAVRARVGSDRVRPLTDTVVVQAPTAVPFAIAATVELYQDADAAVVLELARASAGSLAADLSQSLGRDVVRNQVVRALMVAGVRNASVAEPAVDRALAQHEWPVCTGVSIGLGGG